jgi:hypothetical protein
VSRLLALTWLLLAVVACTPTRDRNADAASVVDSFIAARQARDLEATMACFVDQPEMRSSLGVGWTGRDAVRAIMAYRLTDTYALSSDVRAVGDRAIWTEHVRRGVAGSPAAVFDEDVEAIVVNGRIASLITYGGGAHPTLAGESVEGPALANLFVPLTTLFLVAGAVLAWPPATGVQQTPAPLSTHLIDGLRDYVARRG